MFRIWFYALLYDCCVRMRVWWNLYTNLHIIFMLYKSSQWNVASRRRRIVSCDANIRYVWIQNNNNHCADSFLIRWVYNFVIGDSEWIKEKKNGYACFIYMNHAPYRRKYKQSSWGAHAETFLLFTAGTCVSVSVKCKNTCDDCYDVFDLHYDL